MSEVKILVKHDENGFSKIYIDGKYCGTLKNINTIYSIADVLNKLIDYGNIENTIVVEE